MDNMNTGEQMGKELLAHIFSSLQSLERCLDNSNRLYGEQKHELKDVRQSLDEQEKVLRHMRRVANRLQLEVACDDTEKLARSLQIFYGLSTMVRPEVLATFQLLASGNSTSESTHVETLSH